MTHEHRPALAGRRIIVTGAARGIGFAAARVFVAQGARVAIADLDGRAAAEAAVRADPSGRSIGIEADVGRPDSVAAMVAEAVRAMDGIDGLFNNAGIVHRQDGDIAETTMAAWDATIAVNLTGVFLTCRHAIAAMRESGGGAIVNNASVVASLGSFPSQIAYTAAKGGVVAMSRELGVAHARCGIRVNSVSPGLTRTDMAAQLVRQDVDAARAERLGHVPMGRYGEPEEIARVAAFLLSDAAGYVTAQDWAVDGGLTRAFLCPPGGPAGCDG